VGANLLDQLLVRFIHKIINVPQAATETTNRRFLAFRGAKGDDILKCRAYLNS
jgi:hypothetical protein